MSKTTEEIRIGELAVRFLLEGEDTGGALAMFEFEVAAGGKVPASRMTHMKKQLTACKA